MNDGTESYAKRFFFVVKRGQPQFIKDYLRNIDVNCVNEEGDTALIIAANDRNYIVQKLLIENGAKVNKTDKDGRTALHIESGYGDSASINLLLANNANINKQDFNGRTALHYAVRGRHYNVVDLLVFCGADGLIPDDYNVTAMSLCGDDEMKKLMNESEKTVHAIKLGYIKIERTVLKPGKRRYFKQLGCFVTFPEKPSSSDVYTLSRRVRPEFGRNNLQLMSKELLISDQFEFRVEGGDNQANVIIDVPLYGQPEAYEEIHMKTNVNPIASEETVQSDVTCNPEQEECLVCPVKVDLKTVNTLMLVTQPKKEYLPISADEGGKVTSSIDAFVTFDVDPNTFSKDGNLVHYILPRPFEETEDFLACSHFHDVSYSGGEQPQRQVRMTIPLPPGYSTDKKYKMHVLVREGDDDVVDPDKWTVIDDGLTMNNKTLAFDVPHFCAVQAVESEPISEITIKKDAEIRYQKARKYECEAVFLGLPTKLTNDVSQLLTECTNDNNYKLRIESHQNNGFIDQKPSFKGPFKTYSGQKFELKVSGELTTVDKSNIRIEFHPKRRDDNKRVIDIKPLNEYVKKDSHGQLEICQLPCKTDTEPPFHDAIDLHLKHPEADENHFKPKFKGFLSDKLLKYLRQKLQPSALNKVLRELHVDIKGEEHYLLLLKWRNLSIYLQDCGVSQLMGVLCQAEETEAVEFMLMELKKWKTSYGAIKTKFTTWLEDIDPKSIKKHETNNPPKPMSDDFLRSVAVLMSKGRNKNNIQDMFEELGFETDKIEKVTNNKLYEGAEVQTYLLLKRFRDQHPQKEAESFEILHKAFKKNTEKFPGVDKQCLDIASEWLDIEKTGDGMIKVLSQYIEVARQEDLEQDADENRADAENLMNANTDTNLMNANTGTNIMDANTGTNLMNANTGTNLMNANTGTKLMDANTDTNIMDANTGTKLMDANTGTNIMDANTGTKLMDANTGTNLMDANTGSELMDANTGTNLMNANTGTIE